MAEILMKVALKTKDQSINQSKGGSKIHRKYLSIRNSCSVINHVEITSTQFMSSEMVDDLYMNKMKEKKYHTVGTLPKSSTRSKSGHAVNKRLMNDK